MGRGGTVQGYIWNTLNNMSSQQLWSVIFDSHMRINTLFDHGKSEVQALLQSEDIGKGFFFFFFFFLFKVSFSLHHVRSTLNSFSSLHDC